MVHAPGAVVLPVPPQARGLAGVFGLLEGAYRDGGQTDGVEFSIEIKDFEGKIRRAFVRTVRPRESAADRGRLAFAITLRSGRDREVVLRTHPGSSDAWDWSVWSDLRFE